MPYNKCDDEFSVRIQAQASKVIVNEIQAAEILLHEYAGVSRADEPVTVGVPFPQGLVAQLKDWCLCAPDGRTMAWQVRALANWPDGTVKWASVFFLARLAPDESATFRVTSGSPPDVNGICIDENADGATVDTSCDRFMISRQGSRLFTSMGSTAKSGLSAEGVRLISRNKRGRARPANIEDLEIEEDGPLRATIRLAGALRNRTPLRFVTRLSFFAGQRIVRVETTIHNPSRARHRGGCWNLGDPGSVLMREVALDVATDMPRDRKIHWVENLDEQDFQSSAINWEIHQESSGGANWNSRNHVNREGRIPLRFRGYRVKHDGGESNGLRASPVVCLRTDDRQVNCSVTDFWQKFPSSLQVVGDRIRASIFSGECDDLHEIQAGEQTTRVMWLQFDREIENRATGLSWTHVPLVGSCAPDLYAQSRAIWCLPDAMFPVRKETTELLGQSLDGQDGFFAKREIVDEYGWRHYGDAWGDHEGGMHYDGPRPIMSHCNNQYDMLYGFLVQFFLTGDRRWWNLAAPLAQHVLDIDIYHTGHDKAAYNGGLFWHTAHYHDAGTSTHRTYSSGMKTARGQVPGGGPGDENNYSSGLLLYYYLTGERRARDAVVTLADWVLAMDSGAQHLLGLVSSAPTGFATATASSDYHGPGRGAGNSLNVLLDGYLATDDDCYLEMAEKIIRRTIHPRDDIAARDLGNAELRWSYAVHLQALARFVELMVGLERQSPMVAYARESLLHYARWMAAEERFYLDHPDELEFPTEAWAAHELRKGVVLLMAARYAQGDERQCFQKRAYELLDGGWLRLMRFETRTYTRSLAFVLQQSYFETYCRHTRFPDPTGPDFHIGVEDLQPDLAEPISFVAQKQQILDALKSPIGVLGLLYHAIRPSGWKNAIRRSWPGERLRILMNSLRS